MANGYEMVVNNQKPEPKCCCGCMGVEKGAFVIAILGVILHIVLPLIVFIVIVIVLTTYEFQYTIPHFNVKLNINGSLGVNFFFIAAIHVCIIIAQRMQKAWIYLIYLIVMAIQLISSVIALAIAVYIYVNTRFLPILIIAGIIAVYIPINGWFYSVVYRAYKFMKSQPPIEAFASYEVQQQYVGNQQQYVDNQQQYAGNYWILMTHFSSHLLPTLQTPNGHWGI